MLEVLRDPLGAAAPHDPAHPQHAHPRHHPQQQHLHGSGSTSQSKSNRKQVTTPESQGHYQQHQQQQAGQQSQQQQPLQEVAAGKSPSHQRYASQAVLLQEPQLELVPAAVDSTTTQSNGHAAAASAGAGARRSLDLLQQPLLPQQHQAVLVSATADSISHQPARMSHPEVMQVSIHSMGADMLLQEVRRAFPDSPRLAPLLAVVTFQFCGAAKAHMLQKLHQQQQQHQQQQVQLVHNQRRQQEQQQRGQEAGLDQQDSSCCSSCAAGSAACAGAAGSPGGLCADVDMQDMLSVFLCWQQAVYDHITSR